MLHQCSVCVLVIEYNYTSGHESARIYYLLSFGSGCMGAAASVFYRRLASLLYSGEAGTNICQDHRVAP